MELLTIIRFIGAFLLGSFITMAMVAIDMSSSESINELDKKLLPYFKVISWLLLIVFTIILFAMEVKGVAE